MTFGAQNDVVVQAIVPADIRPLFPLIQAVEPGLVWSQWDRYARHLARGRARSKDGIIVARRRCQTHPCGAVCYGQQRDLRYGLMLTAEHFVAVDLLYPEVVLAALASALDDLAARFNCAAIRSIVRKSDADIVEELRMAGHRDDGRTLTKHRSSEPPH
jgi:hypothetical protein